MYILDTLAKWANSDPGRRLFFSELIKDPSLPQPTQFWARKYLSYRFLKGKGIEIGALHEPLPTYRASKVDYVDRMTVSELRMHYPELKDLDLVEPDIIDDGEKLTSVPNESYDFLIANHMIEHTEDPIGTIEVFLSKVKEGGSIYLAIPNKEHTFDKERPLTTVEHLLKDYEHGPGRNREAHFQEWHDYVDSSRSVQELLDINYSIHFHVWNGDSFEEFLRYLSKTMKLPFVLKERVNWRWNPCEVVFILKKVKVSA